MEKKYEGRERVRNGQATIFRDPIQKADKFEHEGGKILKIYRDGKLLYKVGKRYGIKPGITSYVTIVHLEVDANPGRMTLEEAAREGFRSQLLFKAAFEGEYGENALWRPAWRVVCERKVIKARKPTSPRSPALGTT